MSDLRECPHCGEKKSIHDWRIGDERVIYCGKCKLQSPAAAGEEEADALWNALPRRAEAPADLVEAMREAITNAPRRRDGQPHEARACAAVAAAHADARVREERERCAGLLTAEAAHMALAANSTRSVPEVSERLRSMSKQFLRIAAAIREGRDGE